MRILREEMQGEGRGRAAGRRAEVHQARPGVLRGHGAPSRLRREVGEPGAGHRAVQGQPQARAGDELRGLLRPRDVLEGADAQPDLRRQQGEHRPAGERPHAGPRRLERPPAGARHRASTSGRASAATCRASTTRSAASSPRRTTTRHPPGYKGRPVLYRTSVGVEVVAHRAHPADARAPEQKFSIEDHERMQHDAYSLRAERDQPLFRGWKSQDPDVEKARAMIEGWDKVLTKDTDAGRHLRPLDRHRGGARASRPGRPSAAKRQALVETRTPPGARPPDEGLGLGLESVALWPHQHERPAAHVHSRSSACRPWSGRAASTR